MSGRARFRLVVSSLVLALATSLPADAVIPKGRIGLGDSVMRGATSNLQRMGIRVNTSVSRQFSSLPKLMRQLERRGKLRKKVIVHLGNNGYLESGACNRAVRIAGSRRTVYLVTLKVPRQWRAANNRRLAACARRHGNAVLINWFGKAVNHPSWFANDLYHLTSAGARHYAALINRKTG
jgi:hypothetical protein